jgi:hypothetical protein
MLPMTVAVEPLLGVLEVDTSILWPCGLDVRSDIQYPVWSKPRNKRKSVLDTSREGPFIRKNRLLEERIKWKAEW